MRFRTLVLISTISILVFTAIALAVVFNFSPVLQFDMFVGTLTSDSAWTSIFTGVTKLGDPLPAFTIILILSLILIFKKRIGDLYLLIISSGIGLSFSSLIKNIFKRGRPYGGLIEEDSFSFPSNHSTIATIVALSIIFSFLRSIRQTFTRRLLITLVVIISLAVSISRFILNVHWISDVVAGIALGTAMFFISSIFLHEYKK